MNKIYTAALLFFLSPFVVQGQAMNTPKEEAESLMNAVIPAAEQLLQKHGEFFPFGGAMTPDGKITLTAGYNGKEQPPSAEVIKLLKDGFKSGAKEKKYKATALVYDTRVTQKNGQKTDAIAVVTLPLWLNPA